MSPPEPHAQGTILLVRAHPGARRNEVRRDKDGLLRVSVTQAPDKGKANKAIIALLAKELGLRRSQLELVAGDTSPHKRFLLHGVTAEELARRLAPLTPPEGLAR